MLDSAVIDLLSGGSSFTAGFLKWLVGSLFKHRENKLKYKLARDTSYYKDITLARETKTGGFAWTRRLIAIFIIFVVMGGVWMCAVKGIPISVEIKQSQSWLGHLLGYSPHVTWHKINGFVILQPFVQMMYMIIGFYFGSQGIK